MGIFLELLKKIIINLIIRIIIFFKLNKKKINIQQYFLQLTSLEQIFNNFSKEKETPDNQLIYTRNIDIPITNELISFLFK